MEEKEKRDKKLYIDQRQSFYYKKDKKIFILTK